ncbi:hypothetical protein IE81DRAFT_143270 [Ceraceosorus guamensis]|uniref:Uncharacterized protein n=1 Tax=Ceraceosorus guamensis TaxID=1522189 RepID=A0A316W0Q9_9BASI|nr:hypothetical protein IE81DRAFT_143270 [Ceraceosorus guamensis]PWN42131.1 hypothetical protein IE81DRAFT_143270 [Ceraceosorus guamensis]
MESTSRLHSKFKPPAFIRRPESARAPPAKRPRTASPDPNEDVETEAFAQSHGSRVIRKGTATPEKGRGDGGATLSSGTKAPRVRPNGTPQPASRFAAQRYYLCTWRKPQARKHKTWDGDAVLILRSETGTCTLRCAESFKDLATNVRFTGGELSSGDELMVGGREIEIDRQISHIEYCNGENGGAFSGGAATHPTPRTPAAPVQSFYAKPPTKPFKKLNVGISATSAAKTATPIKVEKDATASSSRSPSPTKTGSRPSGLQDPGLGKEARPRYDPAAEGAIIMKRPDEAHAKRYNRHNYPIVDVVVDPILGRALRPHQVEGVRWLYERVMGMNDEKSDQYGQGAILADEMGLGKTVQTIALVHTLLKQSCYYTSSPSTVQRVLIVCPLSLVKNWKREFRKWLGGNSLNILCVDGSEQTKPERFLMSRTFQVLIIGYEKLRTCVDMLASAQPPIGLIVCDEGHRLKSKDAKTTKMFEALSTPRRIILSGTPVQNDLSEFHAMVDFVNPGLLGDYNVFKKVFEEPIVKSRMQHANKQVRETGKLRNEDLKKVTAVIILRRTAELLTQFLPPKCEQVLFCSPTQNQLDTYRHVLGSTQVRDVLDSGKTSGGGGSSALTLIGVLRKLCNSPELLLKDLETSKRDGEASLTAAILEGAMSQSASKRLSGNANLSGKLLLLSSMLQSIRKETDDKVVLVSNFTATLDIIEIMCKRSGYSFVRLDGKTKQEDRMDLVSAFNRGTQSNNFIFLLSAKTGGVGLNLTGANRLILFDSDWNPSVDRQAMARIHRDGQKKPCFIYRLLLAGTMDEKIYQRQISKIGLSDSLIEDSTASGQSSDTFSVEDLRDIFTLHRDTPCLSHDNLSCSCNGNGIAKSGIDHTQANVESDDEDVPVLAGFVPASQHARSPKAQLPSKRAKLAALHQWGHFDLHKADTGCLALVEDDLVRRIVEKQTHSQGVVAHGACKSPAISPRSGLGDVTNGSNPSSPSKSTLLGKTDVTTLENDALARRCAEERKAALANAVVCEPISRRKLRDARGGRPPAPPVRSPELQRQVLAAPPELLSQTEEGVESEAPKGSPSWSDFEGGDLGRPTFDITLCKPGSLLYAFIKSSKARSSNEEE